MPRLSFRRLRLSLSMARAASGSRAGRRLVPAVEGVEERSLLSGPGYVGVAFGPYVKQWNPTKTDGQFTVPPWNSYGAGNASVANQLAVIARNFGSVATYSSGWFSWNPPVPLDQLNSNVLVPAAAARYNKQHQGLELTVSQGIFQQANAAAWKAEIDTAIRITKQANQIYPGTVNRLIFSNEYVDTAAKTNQVIALINQYRTQVPGVQVGVRMNDLGQLAGDNAALRAALTRLVRTVDFVMVNIYPSPQSVKRGPVAGAQNVAATYNALKALALKVNPKVQVIIGETGWPSQGISFNDLSGKSSTVANEQAFYRAFSQWADANKVPSYFFEAIDEPWKSNKNLSPNSPAGRKTPWVSSAGAEGHFGLYTYTTNNDAGKIVPKFPL